MDELSNIRNFCIIAHIDHGKSTLADRFLEETKTVERRKMQAQYLDQLELERERGITIKMAPVRMMYRPTENKISNLKSQISNSETKILDFSFYILNLIDTPGHSDFSYEVSRALEAVEGAILLVDATQGIQAQTLANFYSAKKANLTIIGVLNKIDVLTDEAERAVMRKELAELLEVPAEEIFLVSGKTGEGVRELLNAVIQRVPPPRASEGMRQVLGRALVFDSFYDNHKGAVASVRVFDGMFKDTENIYLVATDTSSKVKELGYFMPELRPQKEIPSGGIGYIATGVKDTDKIKIGDTVLSLPPGPVRRNELEDLMLHGYKEPNPVIFVSFYAEDTNEYETLRTSLQKLKLNDSALSIEPDQNEILGRGFKVGCLGRLHFEITAERLSREFGVKSTNTFPSVRYRVRTKKGEWIYITTPEELPQDHLEIEEPMIIMGIIFPTKYLSAVMSLQRKFRFSDMHTETIGDRIKLSARMPLVELVSDFDDNLKSVSEGYASFSYEFEAYARADVVRVDMLVSGNSVPGLSRFIPKETVEREARRMVEKLKELLPRQQFAQPVQASAEGRIIARSDIPAMRKELGNFGKNGGDRTRKMKLWKKQQRGKKRLKERSEATISPDVFKELLKKE